MAVKSMPSADVHIQVGNLSITGDIVDMCRIDSDNYLHELVEQSATFAYLATMQAMAAREVSHMKRDRDRLYSELYDGLKQKATDEGAKFTESGAATQINKVPAYQQVNEDICEAEYRTAQLQALCDAFRMRKDMLVQIAMHLRASETPLPDRVHEEVKRRKAQG